MSKINNQNSIEHHYFKSKIAVKSNPANLFVVCMAQVSTYYTVQFAVNLIKSVPNNGL